MPPVAFRELCAQVGVRCDTESAERAERFGDRAQNALVEDLERYPEHRRVVLAWLGEKGADGAAARDLNEEQLVARAWDVSVGEEDTLAMQESLEQFYIGEDLAFAPVTASRPDVILREHLAGGREWQANLIAAICSEAGAEDALVDAATDCSWSLTKAFLQTHPDWPLQRLAALIVASAFVATSVYSLEEDCEEYVRAQEWLRLCGMGVDCKLYPFLDLVFQVSQTADWTPCLRLSRIPHTRSVLPL